MFNNNDNNYGICDILLFVISIGAKSDMGSTYYISLSFYILDWCMNEAPWKTPLKDVLHVIIGK